MVLMIIQNGLLLIRLGNQENLKIENLRGGKLHIEDDIITPKTNRLVIFSPQLNHCVEPFMGDRIVLCVNPWDVKL